MLTKHAPTIAPADPKTHAYSFKNHSYEHKCPACGKSRRQNANFLGAGNVLVCDGVTIKRQNRAQFRKQQEAQSHE